MINGRVNTCQNQQVGGGGIGAVPPREVAKAISFNFLAKATAPSAEETSKERMGGGIFKSCLARAWDGSEGSEGCQTLVTFSCLAERRLGVGGLELSPNPTRRQPPWHSRFV